MNLEQIMRIARNARSNADRDWQHQTERERKNMAARYFVADLSNLIAKEKGFVAEENFLKAIGFEHLLDG